MDTTTTQPNKKQDQSDNYNDIVEKNVHDENTQVKSSSESDDDDVGEDDNQMNNTSEMQVASLSSSTTSLRQRNAIYSKRKYYKKKAFLERLHQSKDDLKVTNRTLRAENQRLQNLLQQAHQKILVKIIHNQNQYGQTNLAFGGATKTTGLPVQNQVIRQQPLVSSPLLNSAPSFMAPRSPSALIGGTGGMDRISAQLALQGVHERQFLHGMDDSSGLQRAMNMLNAAKYPYRSMSLQEQANRTKKAVPQADFLSAAPSPTLAGTSSLLEPTQSLQLLLLQQQIQQQAAVASQQQNYLIPSSREIDYLTNRSVFDRKVNGDFRSVYSTLLEQGLRDRIIDQVSLDAPSATITMLNHIQEQNDRLLASNSSPSASTFLNNNSMNQTTIPISSMESQLLQQHDDDRALLIRQLLDQQQQQRNMNSTRRNDRF